MPRYVALLRGINVGKAKRVAMADLRVLLGRLGYHEVATLLNSGNAVFTGGAEPAATHAGRIRQAVLKKLGVDALVIVKSGKDLAGIVAGNELGAVAADPARLLVAVTNESRALASVKTLARADWGDERLQIGRHAAYLWCADGILESKALGPLLKGLGNTATTRNWATLTKIHALMSEPN